MPTGACQQLQRHAAPPHQYVMILSLCRILGIGSSHYDYLLTHQCQTRLLIVASPGTNPVQLTRGMDRTVTALVKELAALSTEVASDKDLANVAAVSAGE